MKHYGVTDRTIAAVVVKRLLVRKLFVHNALVRAIVRTTLDVMVDSFWLNTNIRFLRSYAEGNHRYPIRTRVFNALRVAYSREIKAERGLRYWGPVRKIREFQCFTDAELMTMHEQRRIAADRGDTRAVKAIEKAILYMRA